MLISQTPSFWLTPRHILYPSRCGDEFHNAVLRSSIIYGGPLMMLDSDLIHNQRIRDGLKRGDSFFEGLFKFGLLKVVMRQEIDGTVDICRTASSLQAPGTAVTEIGKSYYLDARDLTRIVSDQSNVGCHFMLDEVKDRYRTEVTALFQRLASPHTALRGGLPRDISTAVFEHLAALPEDQNVSWSTFLPDSPLMKHLSTSGFNPRSMDRYAKDIFRVARGPYVTAIPDSINCSAIFSGEDREPIDVYRGRDKINISQTVRSEIKRYALSLADHTTGLNMLSAEDLYELITSPEKERFDRTLLEATRMEHSLDEVDLAMAAYLRLVDSKIVAPLTRPESMLFQTEISMGTSTEARSGIGGALLYSVKELAEQHTPGIKDLLNGVIDVVKPIYKDRLKPFITKHLGLDSDPEAPSPPTGMEHSEAVAEARDRLLQKLTPNSRLNPGGAKFIVPRSGVPLQVTKGLYQDIKGESFAPDISLPKD